MRPTISALRGWRPAQLAAAASSLARKVDEFDGAMGAVGRASEAVSEFWRGAAAERAETRIGTETHIGGRVSVAGLAVVDVLNAGIADIAADRLAVLANVDSLEAAGVRVGEDGVAEPTLGLRIFHEVRAAAILAGLGRLDAADRRLAEGLTAALGRLSVAATSIAAQSESTSVILARVGAIPDDAAGLSALWRSLAEAERADLLAAAPSLGSRPGMPAATRDFYNREKLDGLVAEAAAERDRLETRVVAAAMRVGESERLRLHAAYEGAQARVAGYAAVSAQLASDPRAMLMDIDGRGLGAIALNNPDTATHVTTLVPGTGASLSRIGSDLDRAQAMLTAAQDVSPEASHSVIAWAGYEAPQNLLQAADRGYADRGAESLRDFQAGLRASHTGAGSHNTVVGHSYGTTEIGAAASRGHFLDADAIVLIASPGTTVDNVRELSLLGVDPREMGDRVYATKAAHDPFPAFANLGGILDRALDVGAAATGPVLGPSSRALDLIGDYAQSRYTGPFGTDPTDAEGFGARGFTSDPGSSSPLIGWHPNAHSQHWDLIDGRPGQSLQNIAHIMSNQGDDVS